MNIPSNFKPVYLRVGVGYAWHNGAVTKDTRWISIRKFVQSCADVGIRKFEKGYSKSGKVVFPDDNQLISQTDHDHSSYVRVECARLRGTAGSWMWGSIVEHIENADILIFDLAARADLDPARHPGTSHNVLLELGYALKSKSSSQIFIISDQYDEGTTPSDLNGYTVGLVPLKGAVTDQSLRNRLANVVCKVLSEKMQEIK